MDASRIISLARGYECLSCGKCSGTCPVAETAPPFSPRALIERALLDFKGRALESQDYWRCLTCGICAEKCDHGVDFITIVRELRRMAFDAGKRPHYSHGEILQTIMRLSFNAEEPPAPATPSEYYWFRGCARYVEWITEGDGRLGGIEKSVLRILERLGIRPTIPETDVCCGHDLFWTGDRSSYESLARKNIEKIQSAGAKIALTACPECLYMFRVEYPKLMGALPFKALHWTEVAAPRLDDPGLEVGTQKATYHDSCRMGRFLGLYDAPRDLLGRLGDLAEMRSNRNRALCCGTSQWIECGAASLSRQLSLLGEASETRAETLVTSCPKCLAHLKCATETPAGSSMRHMRIVDLATYVAERMKAVEPAAGTKNAEEDFLSSEVRI